MKTEEPSTIWIQNLFKVQYSFGFLTQNLFYQSKTM